MMEGAEYAFRVDDDWGRGGSAVSWIGILLGLILDCSAIISIGSKHR